MTTAAIKACERMPVSRSFKLRGYGVRDLDPCKRLEEQLLPLWKRIDGFYDIYNAVLINEEEKSIAWLRTNGMYADILIGAQNTDIIQCFKELRGDDYYDEK